MRLGFSVKIVGRPGLRSHDSRRWRNNPHLSVSLAYLRDIFLYLDNHNIRMYRMSGELAPYLTHPTFTQFHNQISECKSDLAGIGQMAREFALRLSFHAPAYVLLNSPDPDRLTQSIAKLNALTRILDLMGLGEEAVIVVHVGGHYDDRDRALAGFARTFERLPNPTQKRLVLEHDDRRFGVADCLWLHQETGIRLIFDYLHHQLLNPTAIPDHLALAACLATWPPQQTPKIHISTPATEMVRDRQHLPHPPRFNRHSHYVNPFPIIDFLRTLPRTRSFDMMLEAKACDLALLQFRQHLGIYGSDILERYQIA